MWNEIAPYAVPALVLVIVLRRSLNAKPRKVRVGMLWFMPALITLATGMLLANSPMPNALALAGFAAALALGLSVGWLRARHMELAVDPDTGTVTSKATPIGTILVAALFVVRFGLKLAFPELNAQPGAHPAGAALLWTDAGLLFSAGLVWGRAATTWLRARPLLDAHHAAKAAQ
jgi:hypothetical protein